MIELFSIQNRRFNWSLRTNWNWWMRYVRISLLKYLIQNIFLSVFSFPSLVSHILLCVFYSFRDCLVFLCLACLDLALWLGSGSFPLKWFPFTTQYFLIVLSGICHCEAWFHQFCWRDMFVFVFLLLYFSTEFECVLLDSTEFETMCFLKNNFYLFIWHVL